MFPACRLHADFEWRIWLLTNRLALQLHDSLGNPVSQVESTKVAIEVENSRATAVVAIDESGVWRAELTPAVSNGFIEYRVLVNGSSVAAAPQRVEVVATALSERIHIQEEAKESADGFRCVSLNSCYTFRLIGHRNVMWRLTVKDIVVNVAGTYVIPFFCLR